MKTLIITSLITAALFSASCASVPKAGLVSEKPVTKPIQTPLAKPAFVTVKSAPDAIICNTIKKTGTRLGEKEICMKQVDWDTQKTHAKDVIDSGWNQTSGYHG